jgi:hypothetical protein
MTFKPSHGLWSVENFSDPAGFEFTDATKQSVTGGYAALLPQFTRSASFLHPWAAISGWDIDNSLNTRSVIETDFTVSGGQIDTANDQTGYQQSVGAGGMWEISTPAIQFPAPPSGQTFEYVSTESGSPSEDSYYYRLRSSNDPFVIEFDVASLEQVGTDTIAALPSGELTGLPPLTGIANHGLYISNGPNWDYLEVRPDGIRSYNHPELALPIPLTQPKRFRVGVRANDIFVLAEDGRGLAGIGKFNATGFSGTTSEPILAFGSPYTGHYFSFGTGTVGFQGRSFWDNFKVLVGKLSIDLPDGLESAYSTDVNTLYTPAFEAGVSLRRWNSARVEYLHKLGGTTRVIPQYLTNTGTSDLTGWQSVDDAAITLTEGRTVMRIDMSAVPAGVPSTRNTSTLTGDANLRHTTSTVRFAIEQNSTEGHGPAPLVDAITVQGQKDEPYLETVPDWKPVDQASNVNLYIRAGQYLSTVPGPQVNSTYFFRAPTTTGSIEGTYTEISNFGLTGTIVGTGQIVSGPYETAFQTYVFTTGAAVSGSTASRFLGTNTVANFIPDPKFDKPFKRVSAVTGFVSGFTEGEIGAHMEIPPDFTGGCRLKYARQQVHRMGTSTSAPDYAQKIDVLTVPQGSTCGIEAVIPQGITEVGTQGIFRFNLKTVADVTTATVPDILVYASGSTSLTNRIVQGALYTGGYWPVSVPVTVNTIT